MPPPVMDRLVKKLDLIPHPEGGYFKETYRSKDTVKPSDKRYQGESRSASTAIYYLLGGEDFSSFHKVGSDEIWQYCAGCSLTLYIIGKDTALKTVKIGDPLKEEGTTYQYCVGEGQWFAAKPNNDAEYTLVTCIVSPGFDFKDWAAAERDALIVEYPEHVETISRFTRVGAAKAEEEKKLKDAVKSIGTARGHDTQVNAGSGADVNVHNPDNVQTT